MKISTKGRYALRVMIDLALHDTGEYIALKDISERQGITVKYLEQIVTVLNKAIEKATDVNEAELAAVAKDGMPNLPGMDMFK